MAVNEKKLIKYFGKNFKLKKNRFRSYDFIENFIETNFTKYSVNKDTKKITKDFLEELGKFSKNEFAFLILHCGYIPDYYSHDSSKETLHTKLTETIIFNWSKLIGFKQSILPTQKSSYEDITISDGTNIIVCDAKSFRLGRSQGAPNVKDTIKLADYEKWLSKYENKGIGGLITFPSLHDWKKDSDTYQYVSDPLKKVLLIFYEHLSYLLLSDYDASNLVKILNNYSTIFSKKSKNRELYWKNIIKNLFKEDEKNYYDYLELAENIIQEFVIYKKEQLDKRVKNLKIEIKKLFDKFKDVDKLINEISDTNSQVSVKLFDNVKLIKDFKIGSERISNFRIK